MKHLKVIVLTVTVLLSVSGLFSSRLFAADINAVIRDCRGDVEVKAAGGDWVPARVGMTLEGSALVSTGFKSTATLGIGNSTIVVRPLTRLSLEALAAREGDEQVGLELRAGRVRAEVTPPQSGKIDFSIRGPTATASVRGTRFEFDSVNLTVQAGSVAFTGRDNATVIAPAGKSAVIDRQGRSATPVSVEERQLAQVSAGATAAASGGSGEAGGAPVPAISGGVSPVVAGPNGGLSVPGVIGGPGGGIGGSTPLPGDAGLGASWQ
jgi:hypothetical protein